MARALLPAPPARRFHAVRGSPEERTGADRRSPKQSETFAQAIGALQETLAERSSADSILRSSLASSVIA
jgi:hypothetical protein